MIAAGLILFLAAAPSPVRVGSAADDGCPSSAEVESAIASMLVQSGATPPSQDVANLERRGETLHVELVDGDGVIIAERALTERGSCSELGRMAAILIASWESDVHPELMRAPRPFVRAEPGPMPARPAPTIAAVASPAPSAGAAYDVAAGATLGRSDTLAAGFSLGATWFPRGVGLGLWALGTGEAPRSIAVGAHEARWRRWTASLEIARRAAWTGWAVDPHGGLTVGWLTTEGVDYAQNRSQSAVSVGGTAGVRLARWASRYAALWVDLRGFYFPRRDSVYGTAGGTGIDETPLPVWGGIGSLGVALGQPSLPR